MSMIKCPECGQPVSTNAGTCPHCGIAVSGHLVKCPQCGAYNLDHLDRCVGCGIDLEPQSQGTQESQEPRSATIAPPATDTENIVQHKRKKKANPAASILVLALVAVVICALFWYTRSQQKQREEHDFELLADATNPEFFQEFLINYPSSSHYIEVQERMRMLRAENGEWLLVLQDGKREAFVEFLNNHPNTVHARECNEKLDSIDWAIVQRSDDPEAAVQKYLADHPDGCYTVQATELRNQLAETKVTAEEKSLIVGLLDNFCNALARREQAQMELLMGQTMTLFNDKANATVDDVLQFAASKVANDVIGLHYLVGSKVELTKEKLTDEATGYVADFVLEETINRSDATAQSNNSYKVHAVLGADKKFISMTIQ